MAYDGMRVSMVVAMARGRVIGKDNAMPWYIPADFKHFKAVTMGKPMVMGRKTFESIGKPLPGRTSIVVTRQADWAVPEVHRVPSIEAGLARAAETARAQGGDEIIVAGGAEIYALALPVTDRIYLTEIDADVKGDTLFPELDRNAWREVRREPFPEDERATAPAVLSVLERRDGTAHDQTGSA